MRSDILKVDNDKRRIYGIALEADLEDRQGDWVSEDELEEAAVHAIKSGAVVGRNHKQIGVGTIVASFPLTNELQKALGVSVPSGRGVWLVGLEVSDDATWAAVKRGEFEGLSIGGTGTRSKR